MMTHIRLWRGKTICIVWNNNKKEKKEEIRSIKNKSRYIGAIAKGPSS
jgi:hypothetical protein